MATERAVKARTSQDTRVYLDRYRAGLRKEVEARIPPDLLAQMDAFPPTAWLPIELDVVSGRAIYQHLGHDEALRFWIAYVSHHIETPIFAGPIKTALSVLGATPASLFKWMPKVVGLAFRNVYEIDIVGLEANRGVLRYRVEADEFLNEPVYAVVIEATFRALLRVTSSQGDVRVTRNREARTYLVEVSWR
jgi:hypothetical protein